jgi:hypothetical protein
MAIVADGGRKLFRELFSEDESQMWDSLAAVSSTHASIDRKSLDSLLGIVHTLIILPTRYRAPATLNGRDLPLASELDDDDDVCCNVIISR